MLSWVMFAFAAVICYSISSIFDKTLSVRRFPSRSYVSLMGVFNLLIGLVLLIFVPLEWDKITYLALVPGVLWTFIYILYLKALQHEEVSRVIGIIYTFPIFVAIAAALLLHEVLGAINYIGILLTVAGGVLIAIKKKRHWALSKATHWLVATIFFEVVIEIFDKYLLGELSFFQVQTMFSIGVFLGSAPFFKRTRLSRQSFIVLSSQFFINLASFFFLVAASLTAVSRVAGVLAAQPLMTLVFAIFVSLWHPGAIKEELGKRIFIKIVAVSLICAGVFLLYV